MERFCGRILLKRFPCNFILAQEKRRKGLYCLREKPKVKAHVEAGFQFPRQPCNIYLIEKTLSLKSIVKPRSLNAHTAEGAIEGVRINGVSAVLRTQSRPCY